MLVVAVQGGEVLPNYGEDYALLLSQVVLHIEWWRTLASISPSGVDSGRGDMPIHPPQLNY